MINKQLLLLPLVVLFPLNAMDMVSENRETTFLNYVYAQAPIEAQNIVRHLQDPDFLNEPNFRSTFIVGESGVGKTTLAKALAHKMVEAAWVYHFFSCADFQGKYRGEIAQKLKTMLDSIPLQEKNLVIVDELNQLFEYADNEQYDTNATSKTLWTFLDSQNGNDAFFLIGTMNRLEYAPQQIKSRLLGHTLWIDEVTENKKIELLRFMFANHKNTVLDATCTDIFFTQKCMNFIKVCTKRDLSALVGMCSSLFRKQDTQSKIRTITPSIIEEACGELAKEKGKAKWNQQPQTEATRHHKELLEKQEEAFVKQLYLHIYTNPSICNRKAWFLSMAGVLLTDTQMAFYQTLVQQDEAREKKEKEKAEQEALEKKNAKKGWWS